MPTDAEVAAAQIQTALAPTQQPESEQEQHDFPWLRRSTDQVAPSSEQELHDFPWLKRPQDQPQAPAQPTVSDDVLKSVVDAYNKTRTPLEWAEDVVKPSPMQQFTQEFTRHAVETGVGVAGQFARLAGMGVQAGQQAAVGGLNVQIPDLQGLTVDHVKALREQMLAQRADLSKRQDQIINSGTPDEYGLYGYFQATHGLDQRIKDADAIIASGKPQVGPSGTTEMLAQGLDYGGHVVAPAVTKFIDKVVPTDEQFQNSLVGKIAAGGGDVISLAPIGALTGGIGAVAGAGLMVGNQTYEDAKAHGASDEVADRASLITTMASSAIIAAGGPVVGALAKSFSGLTAKAGMNAIVQAATYAGTRAAGTTGEFSAINVVQNAIAKLTGYDPNRKLDQGTWENIWMGVMYSGVHLATEDIPHIAKMFKPDVTVRNKDGAPAQTGDQTQVTPPAQTPVTPSPAAQQPAPTTPTAVEAQATAAAQEAVTKTPEQVIAEADPRAELQKFMAAEGRTEPQPTAAPQPTAPQPTEQQAAPVVPLKVFLEGTPERDAAAMPPAATEHGAVSVPSNTPGPPTTVEAPKEVVPTVERPAPEASKPEDLTAQRQAWYEKEDFANLPPEPRPEPEDRTIGPADVKREVNDAQDQMGMEDHLHYVPNVEALPDHVKSGLTEGERGSTAQIVRDNKLGDIYVIGDRFDSLNDLRRKIVEETVPYHYRNVTKIGLTHDNTDPRTGYYDWLSDRPVLNTHAIISQEQPYSAAMKTAMHEADGHQGFSRLLGPRNGPVYTQVMGQMLQNFRRLGIIDTLAQMRGYENAQHMAQAYGVPKWETDPQQANKFTEELAVGYTHNFRNADELMRDGPSWWQNGLRRMNNSIRQFLGIRLSDYDVQSLLADSAHALRKAKWTDSRTQFGSPIGEAAKQDAAAFQMANLPPETTATEAGEKADIGSELVKAQARRLQANLKPGQFIREQNLKRAMDATHSFQERSNLLRAKDAVENEESHREVMQQANRVFREDFNGNVDLALQHLIDDETRPMETSAAVPALNEVVDRNADRRIEELRTAGLHDEANLLAARLDRMEQIQGRRVTGTARELSAQRLRHETGATAVSRSKNETQDSQRHEIERPTQANNKRKINEGLDKVKEATEEAAGSLRDEVNKGKKPTYRRIGPGWGLREQHVQDLVDRIDEAVSKGGDVPDKGGLAQVYDSFRKTIQQIITERTPPEEHEAKPISPMSTLRDVMSNYPAYEEAWKRTMDMLQTKDPALAQRFSSAIEEPVGETLANKLAAEQGIDLGDLVYNHFSTTDRITSDLASKIATAATEGRLGAGQEWLANQQNAQGLTNHLQRVFKDILDKEQKARLKSILDGVGATHKPTPGELDQLLNHIAIGGLNSAEWLNLVGPRFGLEGYTPEKLNALRASGDYMMRLRDEGLDNSAIAQKTRAQIAQLTQLNDDPWLTKQFKYLNDVYASGLLTGFATHLPYWQQGALTNATDVMIQGIRAAIKAKDPNVLLMMWPKAMAGYARGFGEFGAIFRGVKPPETFFPEGTYRPPGPMEATPERPLSKFRYVRNTLEAIANLMTKGPAYAVQYANMRYLIEEHEPGLSHQEAHEAASEVVLGTKEERDRAIRDAKDIAERYGLDASQHKMLQGELLDQYKTTRDPADSSLANTTTEDLRDVATRAYDTGMGGSLRGDVRGTIGFISRGLLSFANKHPFFRPIAEFLKVPFNAINEFMAWTPAGITRSARNLVPADTPLLGRAIAEFPLTKGGIESYVGKVPGMAKKIETGEFSQEHIRDIAWNQMAKGFVGSTVGGLLFGTVRALLSNPNPPIQFSYQGPSQYGQQEIERGKGWQPRSVKIGGAWHSYENTPWRMLLSAVGAYEDYFRYEKQNPDTLSNEGLAAWRAMAGGVTSAFGSPLQGLDALLNYFTQFGGQGAQREVGNFVTQVVGSLLSTPLGGTFSRQFYRSFIDQTEYEGDNIWEKSLRYVPVVNAWAAQAGILRPKLNVFGEHMTSTPLKAFPEYGNKVDPNDPVWNYLSTHPKIQLTMPGNQGSVAGIKMTPDEIYQYHLARGPALKEQLARAFESPSFQALPPAIQNETIKRVYEKMASRVGQVAVMRYRQEHPVTQERMEQTKQGELEAALRQEQESTKLPEGME